MKKQCDCEELNCDCWWAEQFANLPETKETTEQFIKRIMKKRDKELEGQFAERLAEVGVRSYRSALDKVLDLIVEELLVANEEGTPTSRLTSLAVSIRKLLDN